MNRHPKFTTSLILTCLCFFLGNCYFNPLVQPIVNPEVKEAGNPFLGLLGLGGTSNLLITGQIRDPNGVALAGLELTPSASNNIKSTSPPYTTDAGGRFKIPYQTGILTFIVFRDGLSFFKLTLSVSSPNEITANTTDAPPNLEVLNLGTISASAPTEFFDLVKVVGLDGEMNELTLHNAEVTDFINSFVFTFSEAPIPALTPGPLVTSWISQNISCSPTVSFGTSMTVTGNTMTLGGFPTTYTVNYECTFNAGILSATGKPLTQRTIRFFFNPPV